MEGFYIPNAFSPNMDGRNDFYKPMIFGRLQSYQFTVFDRFGQVVFKTTDVNKGWDGNQADSIQNIGSYVWICTYQLNDEKPVTKKGTVLLVR
jgi:gliding motility-associated-like protein